MASEKKTQLTPMDIHNKEFKHRGRSGYDRYEVDSYLDQIVDSYGDALDEVVDLKNQNVTLTEQVHQLEQKLANFEQKRSELNEVLIYAQKSANELKASAQKEAERIIQEAKKQAETDTNYQRQQQEVIKSDYERLKEEIGSFRNHIQDMLQKQIDSLSDDEWQRALDKFYHTERFYPGDGSEPLPTVESQDDEFRREAELDEEFGEEEPDVIDKDDLDDLNSTQEPEETDEQPEILTGDSPSHESVNHIADPEPELNPSAGPVIVFPDDYKNHN